MPLYLLFNGSEKKFYEMASNKNYGSRRRWKLHFREGEKEREEMHLTAGWDYVDIFSEKKQPNSAQKSSCLTFQRSNYFPPFVRMQDLAASGVDSLELVVEVGRGPGLETVHAVVGAGAIVILIIFRLFR